MPATVSSLPYDRNPLLRDFTPGPQVQEFIVVDLFCGLGGASQGALRALERLGLTPESLQAKGWRLRFCNVNHWQVAIDTIGRNIAFAEMYNESVENVDPQMTLRGKRPHLLIAASECIMFSSARGNRAIKDQSRTTAAHILRWVDTKPYAIYFENVVEWQTWGPLDEQMRPIKATKGEYYQGFLTALRKRGYDIVEGIVDCSRYGDATSRKRLFILGRSRADGFEPVTLPQPTHTRNPAKEPHLLPCRVARDIIDWNVKGRPITHREEGPHAPATIRRIRAGYAKKDVLLRPILLELLDRLLPISEEFHKRLNARPSEKKLGRKLTVQEKKENEYILRESRAFAREAVRRTFRTPLGQIQSSDLNRLQREAFALVLGQHGGATARDVDEPLPTIAGSGAVGLATVAQGMIVKANASEKSTYKDATQELDQPLSTVVTKDCRAIAQPALSVVTPLVVNGTVSEKSERFQNSSRTADEPLSTVVGVDRHYLAEPILAVVQHGADDERTPDLDAPLPTITSKGSTGIAEPIIAPLYGSNIACGAVDSVDEPLSTVSAQGNHHALAQPVIATIHGLKSDSEDRCRSVDEPLGTVAAGGKQHALAEPVIVARNNAELGDRRAHSVEEPLPTATGRGAGYLVEPIIVSRHNARHGEDRTRSLDEPLPTATGTGAGYLAAPVIVNQKGKSTYRSIDEPTPTITAQVKSLGVAEPVITSNHFENAGGAIDEPLPTCTSATGGGLGIAQPTLYIDPTLLPDDGPFFLLDSMQIACNILYRMLMSRELANSHSLGNLDLSHASEADATKMVGNSIPAETAASMIGHVLRPVVDSLFGELAIAA